MTVKKSSDDWDKFVFEWKKKYRGLIKRFIEDT